MSHEKKLLDGKRKKDAAKSIKEKRAEKRAKHEDSHHDRKPRAKKSLIENL